MTNHYDDRASYFEFLKSQGRFMDLQDTNQQADVSSCAYGGVYTNVVTLAALQTEI